MSKKEIIMSWHIFFFLNRWKIVYKNIPIIIIIYFYWALLMIFYKRYFSTFLIIGCDNIFLRDYSLNVYYVIEVVEVWEGIPCGW